MPGLMMIPDIVRRERFSHPATVIVRPAVSGDLPGIVALVNEQARRGNLLPRSPQRIAESLPDWLVAEVGDRVWGCVSLLRYPSGLVEVRSLAVHDQAQGQGIGRLLVTALITEARRQQIPTLFALTRAVGFFEQCGFTVIDKAFFPEKVWTDCQACPVRECCDETAMILRMDKNS